MVERKPWDFFRKGRDGGNWIHKKHYSSTSLAIKYFDSRRQDRSQSAMVLCFHWNMPVHVMAGQVYHEWKCLELNSWIGSHGAMACASIGICIRMQGWVKFTRVRWLPGFRVFWWSCVEITTPAGCVHRWRGKPVSLWQPCWIIAQTIAFFYSVSFKWQFIQCLREKNIISKKLRKKFHIILE